jgi:tetratricopeptide (TPR) repeat protein
MPDTLTISPNSFSETMLGLAFTDPPGRSADLFSRACVEQYQETAANRPGYLFAQVFEPDVLREVALLAGIPYASLADLSHRPTAATRRLAELVANADDLSVGQLISTAAALISISRFDLAERLLARVSVSVPSWRDAFEVEMLLFLISNRRDDGATSTRAFAGMRSAIESGAIPADRALDACAQAVFWYMKRQELDKFQFDWYLARGQSLTEWPATLDPGSLSSWYRALAMVSAAESDEGQTRLHLRRALEAAEETFSLRPRAYELHFRKAYHESSLEKHVYLTSDRDAAEEAGRALIEIDPAWAPSYGEVAEAQLRFGEPQRAAELYERAVELGPPYYGRHLLRAARTQARLGNHERALTHYVTLSSLAPDDETVLRAGFELAAERSHSSRDHFDGMLGELASRRRRS